MSIGENIKTKRLLKGYTLEELAKKVGTSKQTIQRYESGIISNIPSDKIEMISRISNHISIPSHSFAGALWKKYKSPYNFPFWEITEKNKTITGPKGIRIEKREQIVWTIIISA